jgi:hypothetical protein
VKNSLHWTFDSATDGPLRVELQGTIDENADLPGLFERITRDAVINMRDVERVNSMGVHAWVPLITKASARHKLVVEELSYALVQSANAVANMFGSALVKSCVAPYFCAHCKQTLTVTVTGEEVAAAPDSIPSAQCRRCGQPLEFDELDGYFSFFKARARK